MSARMAGRHGRNVLDPECRIRRSAAEIHVLEPDWVKLLIEAAQALPDVTASHEECSGGLLDWPRLVQIAIQVTISTVYWITGPHPIQAEQFEYQRGGRREPAERESRLRPAVLADQLARGQAVAAGGFDQVIQRACEESIGIEQQKIFGLGCLARALI